MSLADKLSITDLQLKGERVLIRVDFNVPIQDGKITNPAVGKEPPSRFPSHSYVFIAYRSSIAYHQLRIRKRLVSPPPEVLTFE
jgi:hypothetical protein